MQEAITHMHETIFRYFEVKCQVSRNVCGQIYSTMPFQKKQRSTRNQKSIEGMQYSKTATILKKVDGMFLMQLNTSKKGKELFGYVANDGNEFVKKKWNGFCTLNVLLDASGQELFISHNQIFNQ